MSDVDKESKQHQSSPTLVTDEQKAQMGELVAFSGTCTELFTVAELMEIRTCDYLHREAALASRADFEHVLAKAPDVLPEPGDELE